MYKDLEEYVRLGISFVFLALFAYLTVTQNDVSEEIKNVVVLILGYYFGLNEITSTVAKLYVKRRNGVNKDVS